MDAFLQTAGSVLLANLFTALFLYGAVQLSKYRQGIDTPPFHVVGAFSIPIVVVLIAVVSYG